jgi:hypothetical protein
MLHNCCGTAVPTRLGASFATFRSAFCNTAVVDAGSDVTTRCQLRPVSTTSWQHPVLCQTLQRGLGANMNLSYAFGFDCSSADSSAVCDQLGL